MKIEISIVILIGLLFGCNQRTESNNWREKFQAHNVEGTFILKDLKTDKTLVYNETRSNESFVPASTFKILNSMIALQESSISTVDDTIRWDGVDQGYSLWNRDQTMRTAFPISCIWFYQELARITGEELMHKWIIKSDYGNKKIGNKVDRFWLDGNLAISANEQIDFLEKLIKNELPFDKNIQESVKEIMITDSTEIYTIHSKTGWSQGIGWNIGFIKIKDNYLIFAMNIDMDNIKLAKIRKLLTYEILKEQKVI